jgi:predicted RNA-binding Zn-ribbon protein involved in translation (DUF1610 family)
MSCITLSLVEDEKLLARARTLLASSKLIPTSAATVRVALEELVERRCPECGAKRLVRGCACKASERL